jgi:hypothetical protein
MMGAAARSRLTRASGGCSFKADGKARFLHSAAGSYQRVRADKRWPTREDRRRNGDDRHDPYRHCRVDIFTAIPPCRSRDAARRHRGPRNIRLAFTAKHPLLADMGGGVTADQCGYTRHARNGPGGRTAGLYGCCRIVELSNPSADSGGDMAASAATQSGCGGSTVESIGRLKDKRYFRAANAFRWQSGAVR